MKIRRPVIWLLVFYGMGILIGYLMGLKSIFFLIAIIVFLALGIVFWKRWQNIQVILLLIGFILIGILNTSYRLIPSKTLDIFLEKNVIIEGRILEKINQRDEKLTFIMETDKITYEDRFYENKEKIRVSLYSYLDPEKLPSPEKLPFIDIGDKLTLKGKIETPQGQRNPKGFDYRAYLSRKGIHYTLGASAENIITITSQDFSPRKSWILAVKKHMGGAIDTYVEGREASLLKSMVIGERWGLPSDLRKEFSETGVAHILAISGLHVGFLVLLLHYVALILTLSPRSSFFLQGGVLIFYCLMIGFTPSVVRATIMALIILGGRTLGRRPDPLNSLCLAAFIILIKNPLDLLEIGFQLSFGAVLGIILYNGVFKDFIHNKLNFIPNKIGDALAIMLAAQLGTWPLIAFTFNMFSPISFIANLILIPLAGFIVTLGFLIPLVAPIVFGVANLMGWWAKILAGLLIDINTWLSSLPWSYLRVVSPGLLFIIIYYLLLLVLSKERPRFIKKPIPVALLFLILMAINAIFIPLIDQDFKVVFVDVGQGDCIYIKTPDRMHIIIDGGGQREGLGDFDVGYEVVLPFLLKNGVKKLDLMVMSHGHDDHFGGLIPVAKEMRVGAFMEYPPKEPTERYMDLKEALKGQKTPCISVSGGQSFKIGKEVYMDIIYPVPDERVIGRLYEGNENNLSLVARLRYKDTSILFTGDIEKGVESYLSEIWNEGVSILKVAHHGSKTSSIKEWTDIIAPDVAVIQSGKNNFGHPNPLVVKRFVDNGTRVYNNHNQGAIICTYKKRGWNIEPMLRE